MCVCVCYTLHGHWYFVEPGVLLQLNRRKALFRNPIDSNYSDEAEANSELGKQSRDSFRTNWNFWTLLSWRTAIARTQWNWILCLFNLLIQRSVFVGNCLGCVIFTGLRVCNNHKNVQEMNWSCVNRTRTIIWVFFSSFLCISIRINCCSCLQWDH